MKEFDSYEIRGVVAPGAALAIGLVWLFPDLGIPGTEQDFSIGDFGVFLIVAFLAGHLLQGVANGIEATYWSAWGGRPTDWLRTRKHTLLSESQIEALPAALARIGAKPPSRDTARAAWASTVAQAYASLNASERTRRIDVFNSNYGLFRGLALALLVLGVCTLATHGRTNLVGPILLALAVLATVRMHRFSVYYARELFVQFLQAEPATANASQGGPPVEHS